MTKSASFGPTNSFFNFLRFFGDDNNNDDDDEEDEDEHEHEDEDEEQEKEEKKKKGLRMLIAAARDEILRLRNSLPFLYFVPLFLFFHSLPRQQNPSLEGW